MNKRGNKKKKIWKKKKKKKNNNKKALKKSICGLHSYSAIRIFSASTYISCSIDPEISAQT